MRKGAERTSQKERDGKLKTQQLPETSGESFKVRNETGVIEDIKSFQCDEPYISDLIIQRPPDVLEVGVVEKFRRILHDEFANGLHALYTHLQNISHGNRILPMLRIVQIFSHLRVKVLVAVDKDAVEEAENASLCILTDLALQISGWGGSGGDRVSFFLL